MAVVRSILARRNRSRGILHGLSIVAAVGLTLMLAASALAATTPMRWHRLNVHSDPAEHERFSCLASGSSWRCLYDKIPEPTLGLAWDSTRGTFSGTETDSFICPAWFPSGACASADTVVSGSTSFTFPRHSGGFDVDQQLLVGDDGRLWIYWVDLFVCPWYPTFSAALANADEESCTFAP
jgi:hypothetical protein